MVASWYRFFFAAGFRPFFLLAALHAAASGTVWAVWLGLNSLGHDLALPIASPPTLWHAHEMLFGFLSAALTGFLLTAVPNWTGTAPVKGRWLLALVLLWLAGRIAFWLSGWLPPVAVIVADTAFWPLLIWLIGRALLKAPTKRNQPFLILLILLWTGNLADHLGIIGVLADGGSLARQTTLNIIVLMMVIIGGRITPTFSRNWLVSHQAVLPPETLPWLERASILSVVAVSLIDLLATALPEQAGLLIRASIAALAAVLLGYRLWRWQPWRIAAEPLLWVLHLGAGWLALGFALRAYAMVSAADILSLPVLDLTAALHAHFIGAAGTLILGVMGRASRGHSGLSLTAGRLMSFSYLLAGCAAVVRIVGPLLWTSSPLVALSVAGTLFSIAYAVFLYDFIPVLLIKTSKQ